MFLTCFENMWNNLEYDFNEDKILKNTHVTMFLLFN
jgi:hypothetical protein